MAVVARSATRKCALCVRMCEPAYALRRCTLCACLPLLCVRVLMVVFALWNPQAHRLCAGTLLHDDRRIQ